MALSNIQLVNGTEIPQIGLGLWRIEDDEQLESAVAAALEAGYTHFDTAQIYGNEAMLGAALKKLGAKREELFITSKLWNDNQWLEDVLPSFEETLANLQTDYVDLFLMHFPVTETRQMAWRLKMQEIYQSGRAKAIGVSNYTVKHLEEMKAWGLLPAVNQVELHVFLQQPELVEYCRANDIVIEAYSPLAHGYGLDNETLQAIAKKHAKSTAQIMLRWCAQQGFVVLPKSTHAERIKENIDIFDFELDDDDLEKIKKLDKNLRTCWDPTNVA